jgi:hypothetical protein
MRGTAAAAVLAAMRVFLAVALLAGIVGAFRVQRSQRRKALAVFRRMRLTGEGEVFFVRHASERDLADRSRAFAGDGFGVVTVTPRAVAYRADSAEEHPWSVEFLPGQARAEWVGRRMMNGAWSWFTITAGGQTHYFSSAERSSVFGSRRLTRKIHDAVLARLALKQRNAAAGG